MYVGIVDDGQAVLTDVGAVKIEIRPPGSHGEIERNAGAARPIRYANPADAGIDGARQNAGTIDAGVEGLRTIVVAAVVEAIAAVVGPHFDTHRLRSPGNLHRIFDNDENVIGENDCHAAGGNGFDRIGDADSKDLGTRVEQVQDDFPRIRQQVAIAHRAVVVGIGIRRGDVVGVVDAPVAVVRAGADVDRAGVVANRVVRRILGHDRDRIRQAGTGGGGSRRYAKVIDQRCRRANLDLDIVDEKPFASIVGLVNKGDTRVSTDISRNIGAERLIGRALIVGKGLDQVPADAAIARDVNLDAVVGFPAPGFAIIEGQRGVGESG